MTSKRTLWAERALMAVGWVVAAGIYFIIPVPSHFYLAFLIAFSVCYYGWFSSHLARAADPDTDAGELDSDHALPYGFAVQAVGYGLFILLGAVGIAFDIARVGSAVLLALNVTYLIDMIPADEPDPDGDLGRVDD